MNGAQNRYGTGSTDNLNLLIGNRFPNFILVLKVSQYLMRPLDNRVISQIRHFLLGKSFGNRNHPIRKRDKALNKSIAAVGRPCQRNLRRTAANVKHQRPLDVTGSATDTPTTAKRDSSLEEMISILRPVSFFTKSRNC